MQDKASSRSRDAIVFDESKNEAITLTHGYKTLHRKLKNSYRIVR